MPTPDSTDRPDIPIGMAAEAQALVAGEALAEVVVAALMADRPRRGLPLDGPLSAAETDALRLYASLLTEAQLEAIGLYAGVDEARIREGAAALGIAGSPDLIAAVRAMDFAVIAVLVVSK